MRFVLICFALLAALGASWAYAGRAAVPPAWKTAAATRGGIQSAVLATGTLKPVVTVQVGSQISGLVVQLEADFNTPVTQGQVIAKLDPATYRAKLDQARADLAVADATVQIQEAALERARTGLRTAENTVADAERTLGRTEPLARTGVVTEKQLQADRLAVTQARIAVESARTMIRGGEADLAVARAQVGQKSAAVSIAETDLARTTILSPVTGIVVNRQVDIGQTVAASLQAPILFEIAQDLRDMRLEASIDEADIGRVREGQDVTFTVDAHPGRRFEGTVAQVRKAPKVVQNVTTYTVVIATENPNSELLPGMTANVRVVQAEREDVVKVPATALRFRPEGEGAPAAATGGEPRARGEQSAGSGPGSGRGRGGGREAGASRRGAAEGAVYVSRGGVAERVPVEVGLRGDSEVEVVSGLDEGAEVIVGPADGAAGASRPRRQRGPFGF